MMSAYDYELPASAIAQTPKKISFLTWNLVHLEAQIKGWIGGFTASRPGVEVEWIDKKGPEVPVYYATQLAAVLGGVAGGQHAHRLNGVRIGLRREGGSRRAALDLHPVLDSISVPTLVIAAAEDPGTPPDHGRAIADGIPGARFELIQGAAHLANVEKAELVTPLIAGFIDAEQEGR